MINHTTRRLMFTFVIALALLNAGAAVAQTTAFTYQGRLTDGGNPADGSYDLTFKLFDTATAGAIAQGPVRSCEPADAAPRHVGDAANFPATAAS